MASVEGFAPLQRPLGFGGMDGEPALHRQFFISSLYAAMGGIRGNLQKCMGFMSFSQHTCPLYEQSRRSGLSIIGMGTKRMPREWALRPQNRSGTWNRPSAAVLAMLGS